MQFAFIRRSVFLGLPAENLVILIGMTEVSILSKNMTSSNLKTLSFTLTNKTSNQKIQIKFQIKKIFLILDKVDSDTGICKCKI